jgi:hypothetical protein
MASLIPGARVTVNDRRNMVPADFAQQQSSVAHVGDGLFSTDSAHPRPVSCTPNNDQTDCVRMIEKCPS